MSEDVGAAVPLLQALVAVVARFRTFCMQLVPGSDVSMFFSARLRGSLRDHVKSEDVLVAPPETPRSRVAPALQDVLEPVDVYDYGYALCCGEHDMGVCAASQISNLGRSAHAQDQSHLMRHVIMHARHMPTRLVMPVDGNATLGLVAPVWERDEGYIPL